MKSVKEKKTTWMGILAIVGALAAGSTEYINTKQVSMSSLNALLAGVGLLLAKDGGI